MTTTTTDAPALERLSSGIPGLDTVLGGGFFRSGVYILHGLPGSGKTIFANQLCFAHVAAGGTAVYVTLLAESHSRMLQHIRALRFFDETAIPERLTYLSAFHQLETGGLKGLVELLRREMRARSASVLVLDGLVAAAEVAQSDSELKRFVHELQTSAVFHGCTAFLLTSGSPHRVQAEHTMVDGILELEDRLSDVRADRSIQVLKFRGGAALRGKHGMRIGDGGIDVFPRIEALFDAPPAETRPEGALSTGVDSLDALIAVGGYGEASSTVVLGSSGTGKTTFGLHFLARSTPAEPGLMFGFFESAPRLRAKARAIGLDLEALEAQGALTLAWHAQGEHLIDELGHRLLERVRARGVRRVVIDGLSGFFESAIHAERTGRYFACLTNELRRRGVTALLTLETRDAVGSMVSTPFGVSAFVDNLLFLRFVEAGGEVKRLLTITKMRDSDFDPGVRAVEISRTGLRIAGRFVARGDVIPSARPVGESATPAVPERAGDSPSGG
jgi:circadian clock protein KaiC